MERDPRIDAYIANAAPFARPILERLRALVHEAIPEAGETIKWGMPHFTVGCRNLAGMAAFKAHCALAIHGEGRQGADPKLGGMGGYGKIATLADLPDPAVLGETLRTVRDRIVETGRPRRPAPKPAAPKAEIAMPDDLAAALSDGARAYLDGLAPSYRREYLEWIVSAKRPETRQRRIASAAAQLAEGRKLNWKYER